MWWCHTRTGVQQIATTDDKEETNSEPIIDQGEPGCRQIQDGREVVAALDSSHFGFGHPRLDEISPTDRVPEDR